jgi:hypothetical protein
VALLSYASNRQRIAQDAFRCGGLGFEMKLNLALALKLISGKTKDNYLMPPDRACRRGKGLSPGMNG